MPFAIGNDELKGLPNAEDHVDENGEFKVIHTHENGTEEICTVKKATDTDGVESWTIGTYTTKDEKMYLAVVGGKILSHVKLYKG